MRRGILCGMLSLTLLQLGWGEKEESVRGLKLIPISGVPHQINYQGWLGNASDTTGVTGSYTMVFTIYDAETGGNNLWSELHNNVQVSRGIFNVILGSNIEIPPNIFTGSPLWMEIKVNDEILTPRQKIVSVGYAMVAEHSQMADTAEYVDGSNVHGEVSLANYADTAGYVVNPTPDDDWIISSNVLYPVGDYGLAMRQTNVLYGIQAKTHVNFGVACTTGTAGTNFVSSTVSGGLYNTASQSYATVAGGRNNIASGYSSTVSGGKYNTASDYYATVSGGRANLAEDDFATVSGGMGNYATGQYASISGGQSNTAEGFASTISGGKENASVGSYSVVGGGASDTANAIFSAVLSGWTNISGSSLHDSGAVVAGGKYNSATERWSFIGGGYGNTASGLYSSVVGGNQNSATANNTFVGGGNNNTADVTFSGVVAGVSNTAHGDRSFIGAGTSNYTAGWYSGVVGGYADSVKAKYGGILAGYSNLAGDNSSDTAAIVAGGWNNSATEAFSFIGGGKYNAASGKFSTISGGVLNSASGIFATIGGGIDNTSSGSHATVGGGSGNTAGNSYASVGGGASNHSTGEFSTIGGGYNNSSWGKYSIVGGGEYNESQAPYSGVFSGRDNVASDTGTVVVGGRNNNAAYWYSFVGGGENNTAGFWLNGYYATISGGRNNTAKGYCSTVSGGSGNYASSWCATVSGGKGDTVFAWYGFATNYSTYVDIYDDNSSAFTTSHTTAPNQVRAASFSTGTLVFSMDHPSDPMNKILNQYALGSSEPTLVYSGVAYIGNNGRVEVQLPEYFDDINTNPRIQLTGVGTFEVYVAEEVKGNHFVIGGKPGTKVYWTVIAERKDIHARIAKILTPVEQQKTGKLVNHSLDDDALIGIYDRVKDKGEFTFRTSEGRQAHEEYRKNKSQHQR